MGKSDDHLTNWLLTAVFTVLAGGTIGLALLNRGQLSFWWWVAFGVGTTAAVVGVSELTRHRNRAAGFAMVVAALSLPTGLGALANAALLVLAVVLLLVRHPHEAGPSAHPAGLS